MKLKFDFEVTEVLSGACAVSVQENENGCKSVIRLENETTVRIFTLIQEGNDIDSIVNTMLNEYDVDQDILREEVEKVISVLDKENLIER